MKSIVLFGPENMNKVKLDKGFKSVLGIGLKQGVELTERLLANKQLEITNLTDEQITKFEALAKDANVAMRFT